MAGLSFSSLPHKYGVSSHVSLLHLSEREREGVNLVWNLQKSFFGFDAPAGWLFAGVVGGWFLFIPEGENLGREGEGEKGL